MSINSYWPGGYVPPRPEDYMNCGGSFTVAQQGTPTPFPPPTSCSDCRNAPANGAPISWLIQHSATCRQLCTGQTTAPTSTLTPSPTPLPGRCRIVLTVSKSAFIDPNAPNAVIATIPAGTQLTVFGRFGEPPNLIVNVLYNGQLLWIDSSSGVSSLPGFGDCDDLFLVPPVDPISFCTPTGAQSCVDIYQDSPQEILAHVLFAEAASTGAPGMANVAQVIRNRQAAEGRDNIVSVVMASPLTVDAIEDYTFVGLGRPANRESALWEDAMRLAGQLLNGEPLTPSPHPDVIPPDVIYYCAADRQAYDNVRALQNGNPVHVDIVAGTYHMFRNDDACQ